MAFVGEFRCLSCGKEKHEVTDHTRICADCKHEKKIRERTEHLAKLKLLPLEDRITRIEEMLHDLDLERRMKALDSLTTRY